MRRGRFFGWLQGVLFACAGLTLVFCGFVLIDDWVFQKVESRQLDRLLADRQVSPASPPPAVIAGLIGRIEIPRLGLSAIGRPGNVGISGHRDTFFRPLRNIRRNDIVVITTVSGEYRYRVVSTTVVSPHDVAVLDPTGNEMPLKDLSFVPKGRRTDLPTHWNCLINYAVKIRKIAFCR